MQHEFHKELSAVIEGLQKAWNAAEQLPPIMAAFKIRVQNVTRIEMNVLNAQLGQAMTTHGVEDSGPVTSIMGEPVNRPVPVTAEALKPSDHERDKFLSDRDNLYSQFATLKNDQIYTRAKAPGGEPILRACGKKAGVTNYADAKINDIFINQIRKAIEAENKLNAELKEAEQKLKTA